MLTRAAAPVARAPTDERETLTLAVTNVSELTTSSVIRSVTP